MDAASPGTIGGTYAGNPICCAASLATIKYMEEININALGEKVFAVEQGIRIPSSVIDVDVRNFSPGIYFVKFQNQDRTIQKRFVKN